MQTVLVSAGRACLGSGHVCLGLGCSGRDAAAAALSSVMRMMSSAQGGGAAATSSSSSGSSVARSSASSSAATWASRYDFYDPSRDVYKEYKDKWAPSKEEAPERKPRSNRPNPLAPVHPRNRDRSPLLAPRAAASAPAVAAHLPTSIMDPSVQGSSSSNESGSYDWPEGYGALLQSYLEGSLALPAEAAGRLVEAARLGLVPCSKSLLRTRYLQLKDLEPRFPGFDAASAVLSEPRLLRHSASKLFRCMLLFADGWPAQPVGPLMGCVGEFVVRDPVGLAHRLHALSRALREDVGMALDARRMLNARCSFLEASPYELEARVEAAVTIFGREGAARVLGADLSLPLSYSPQELNGAVLALREAFQGQPLDEQAGRTAEDAARTREYVTDLVAAWPGVLALPARYDVAGVRRLLRAVRQRDADSKARYKGQRDLLLADVLEKPELLRAAMQGAEGSGVQPDAAGAEE